MIAPSNQRIAVHELEATRLRHRRSPARLPSLIAAAVGLVLGPRAVWAGGAWVYETGTADLGTASAGRAALAADASTAFGNPAGMTRLEGSQLQLGLQPLVVTTEFDVGPQTTTSGTNGGNAGGFVPAGGVYGVYGLRPDRLSVGADD